MDPRQQKAACVYTSAINKLKVSISQSNESRPCLRHYTKIYAAREGETAALTILKNRETGFSFCTLAPDTIDRSDVQPSSYAIYRFFSWDHEPRNNKEREKKKTRCRCSHRSSERPWSLESILPRALFFQMHDDHAFARAARALVYSYILPCCITLLHYI